MARPSLKIRTLCGIKENDNGNFECTHCMIELGNQEKRTFPCFDHVFRCQHLNGRQIQQIISSVKDYDQNKYFKLYERCSIEIQSIISHHDAVESILNGNLMREAKVAAHLPDKEKKALQQIFSIMPSLQSYWAKEEVAIVSSILLQRALEKKDTNSSKVNYKEHLYLQRTVIETKKEEQKLLAETAEESDETNTKATEIEFKTLSEIQLLTIEIRDLRLENEQLRKKFIGTGKNKNSKAQKKSYTCPICTGPPETCDLCVQPGQKKKVKRDYLPIKTQII